LRIEIKGNWGLSMQFRELGEMISDMGKAVSINTTVDDTVVKAWIEQAKFVQKRHAALVREAVEWIKTEGDKKIYKFSEK